MTDIQKATCLGQLNESENAITEVVEDVSDQLFITKSAPDVWSIAEVMEHIIKVEKTVIITLQQLAKSPTNIPLEQPKSAAEVMELSASRELKSKAPENFLPEGIFTSKEAALIAFKACRQATNDFVNSNALDLDEITFPHPRIGVLNGNNWLTFVSGHSHKHIAQIKELKLVGNQSL